MESGSAVGGMSATSSSSASFSSWDSHCSFVPSGVMRVFGTLATKHIEEKSPKGQSHVVLELDLPLRIGLKAGGICG